MAEIQAGNTIYTVDDGTDPKVVEILSGLYNASRETRIQVIYGDTVTGNNWLEEHDTCGYVGRTTGIRKSFILVHNKRSLGGGLMSTASILRIQTTKGKVLYTHPNYRPTRFVIDLKGSETHPVRVLVNRVVQAQFTHMAKAIKFMHKVSGGDYLMETAKVEF